MPTLTRKQREIQEREGLILRVARRMLLERGYLGVTMDRIAKQAEYSKGTIYHHFSCKEEILAALAVQTAERRCSFFDRAARFRGRSRERMSAIGVATEVFLTHHPDDLRVEQVIHAGSVREKTSDERQRHRAGCERRCLEIATGIVRDALSQGDLVLQEGVAPDAVTFGLWTMTMGCQQLILGDLDLRGYGIAEPLGVLRRNCQRLMDGFGWQPLSTEWDYVETNRRIRAEVFPEELR